MKPDKKQVLALINAQQWAEAKAACIRVCKAAKNDAEAWFLLGGINGQMGNPSEAQKCCRRAVAIRPDFAQGYYNLGIALRDQGLLKEAAENFRITIRKMPNFIQAHSDLGFVMLALNEPKKAAEAYRAGLQYAPNAADGHANLGIALYFAGALEEASTCFHKALQLKPGEASFHDHLGTILCCQGRLKDALINHREALRLEPNEAKFYSNYLLILHYDPEQNPAAVFTEHRRWGGLHVKLAVVPDSYVNKPDPSRRLRIGYISSDFRVHSVAYFFQPLLENHDPATVETFCYSNVKYPDSTTSRLEASSNHWRKVSGMSDAEIFDTVQADGIDIFVDLAGHTGGNRLGVFAQKPAPLQVTYLGYPDTTGLSTIDYRFTDALVDPPGMTDHFHTETLIRLPHGFLCYRPAPDAPPPMPLAMETEGHITFGSFNNWAKINDAVIASWAEILKAVPASRLIIKSTVVTDEATRERYQARFEANGISRNRVDLLGLVKSHVAHLALYTRIDIALDTFPYNGTTTTCEALWMGIPVITLAGQTHASRVGASLLSQLGLSEFIAENSDQYHRLAVSLANDRQKLIALHASLRGQMQQSSLCDATTFARDIEAAYRTIWGDWCLRHQG